MSYLSNQWILLSLGGLFVCFTGMKWNVPIFAWILFIPFLRYVRLGHPFKILLPSLILFQIISTLRIVSEPFHLWIAIFSGIQAGILFTFILWLWNFVRIRYQKFVSPILFFSFLCCIFEWFGGYFSDLGVWGMLANSQLGNLILLQSVSLIGATGLSFFIYLINVSLEQVLSETFDEAKVQRQSIFYVMVSFLFVLLLYFYGTFRLSRPIPGEQIKVATITTKYAIGSIFSDANTNTKNTQVTLYQTTQAAKEGAKVVVWNEGAILVKKEEEPAFLDLISKIAKENNIEIIAAYIVQLKESEFFFDNKLVWIALDGTIRQTYFKQFLVPGEPVSKYQSEIKAIQTQYGKMSVAICYDYDSLRVTEIHSKEGSGITFIPASDWLGINPFHTEMAVLRGIENGSSIVRSTRDGLSGIFDAYGRAKGTLDSFESNDGVLVSSVPFTKFDTLYTQYGNWFVGVAFLYFTLSFSRFLFSIIKSRIITKL
ncbi:nitrilase-related carbon-nitrogen hydrolase [Leptospira jelokensis]|uniref:Acyltransferase n=1 Tax=Leptospira jelokensis TaxID=2484931 RepID=A0A4Z0ZX53_9LEPT|nr:nitrilase-related carbon-nitrogen hydrolase [Leptospira jelokensis]TGL75621.1 acyltransferase [Leptospira jelokensis]